MGNLAILRIFAIGSASSCSSEHSVTSARTRCPARLSSQIEHSQIIIVVEFTPQTDVPKLEKSGNLVLRKPVPPDWNTVKSTCDNLPPSDGDCKNYLRQSAPPDWETAKMTCQNGTELFTAVLFTVPPEGGGGCFCTRFFAFSKSLLTPSPDYQKIFWPSPSACPCRAYTGGRNRRERRGCSRPTGHWDLQPVALCGEPLSMA